MTLKTLLKKIDRKKWKCKEAVKSLLELYYMDNPDLVQAVLSTHNHLNGIGLIDMQDYREAQSFLSKLYHKMVYK